MKETVHVPVLLQEVLDYMVVQPDGLFIDGTAGGGGHISAILEKISDGGQLHGFDLDVAAIERLQQRFSSEQRLTVHHASYTQIDEFIAPSSADGILVDLGLSSDQLDSDLGFSFLHDDTLDMRFDTTQGQTAADVLNTWSEDDLVRIFYEYGEERYSRKIARAIIERRVEAPLQTTTDLLDIIRQEVPQAVIRKSKKHEGTRVFQALRIAVNDEFGNICAFIPKAIDALKKGGRLCIISFHSKEDRIVKRLLKEYATSEYEYKNLPNERVIKQAPIKFVQNKSIKPSDQEVAQNPRSRSAQLRVVEKIV
jgi:16S rRNA (cytosine1402-N4)-methyltransferase